MAKYDAFKFPLDSASDRHMTPFKEFLVESTVRKLEQPMRVGGINPIAPLYATHVGTMRLPLLVGGVPVMDEIEDVLLVPGLQVTIISLGYFQLKGYDVITVGVKGAVAGHTKVLVDGKVRLEGTQQPGSPRTFVSFGDDGEYLMKKLAGEVVPQGLAISSNSNFSNKSALQAKVVFGSWSEKEERLMERKKKLVEEIVLLHNRLGHPSAEVLFETCKANLLFGEDPTLYRSLCKVVRNCDACLRGKAKARPHPAFSLNRSSVPGECWQYDTFGPSREFSLSGNKYAGVLTDACSMYSHVVFGRHKNQLPGKIVPILRVMSRTFSCFAKFRSDNAPELKVIWDLCAELGVLVEKTVPGESAQNAAAERMIGVLTEKARVLLLQSGASRGFWAEAFLYACWLNNLLAHRRLGWRVTS